MIKRHRLLLLICGFIFAAGLAHHSGPRVSPVYANVTLRSFTATSTSGQPEVSVDWETATQFGTLGFYILRSDSATGPWARVSDFIYSTGDDLTGGQYQWLDTTTALNHFYSYKLEEITPNQSEFYGPITVIAGVLATNTPTPTRTRTPTATSTPTRTPTSTATPTETEVVDPPATPRSRTVVTPRVATGATITPRPPSASGSSGPAEFTATPAVAVSTTDLQLLTPAVTAAPSLSTAPLAAANVSPLPTAANVAQAPAPTLAPTEAGPAVIAPGVVAPAVVVTEAAPLAASANSSPGGALMLIIAAMLFLSLAFVILRQARQ